jgi:16S rRNA (cytidine1402-2'-O)-methyltransferase
MYNGFCMNGTLYIVATPIGNTEDISARAKRILDEVDIVAAEDTRTTQILFNILGIQNKTVSNHKFNEKHQVDFLIAELEKGKNIALVSDAGTPCISDPGGIIVQAAAERGISVIGICGASSVITALSVCGFSFNSFAFYGFLPKSANEIKKAINVAIKSKISVAIFFESPKRITKTLEIFVNELPEAELCLCNDLTKKFERIYRGKTQKILNELNDNPSAEKGEYTLVVNLASCLYEDEHHETISPEALVVDYIIKNKASMKDAVNALAVKFRDTIAKKEFYTASLKLKALLSRLTTDENEQMK